MPDLIGSDAWTVWGPALTLVAVATVLWLIGRSLDHRGDKQAAVEHWLSEVVTSINRVGAQLDYSNHRRRSDDTYLHDRVKEAMTLGYHTRGEVLAMQQRLDPKPWDALIAEALALDIADDEERNKNRAESDALVDELLADLDAHEAKPLDAHEAKPLDIPDITSTVPVTYMGPDGTVTHIDPRTADALQRLEDETRLKNISQGSKPLRYQNADGTIVPLGPKTSEAIRNLAPKMRAEERARTASGISREMMREQSLRSLKAAQAAVEDQRAKQTPHPIHVVPPVNRLDLSSHLIPEQRDAYGHHISVDTSRIEFTEPAPATRYPLYEVSDEDDPDLMRGTKVADDSQDKNPPTTPIMANIESARQAGKTRAKGALRGRHMKQQQQQ